VASAALPKTNFSEDIRDVIASEMSHGVERAVECWMAQIDEALNDSQLTSLGRLNAVNNIVRRYKYLTGKSELQGRKVRNEF